MMIRGSFQFKCLRTVLIFTKKINNYIIELNFNVDIL